MHTIVHIITQCNQIMKSNNNECSFREDNNRKSPKCHHMCRDVTKGTLCRENQY